MFQVRIHGPGESQESSGVPVSEVRTCSQCRLQRRAERAVPWGGDIPVLHSDNPVRRGRGTATLWADGSSVLSRQPDVDNDAGRRATAEGPPFASGPCRANHSSEDWPWLKLTIIPKQRYLRQPYSCTYRHVSECIVPRPADIETAYFEIRNALCRKRDGLPDERESLNIASVPGVTEVPAR